ncbi:hypothetical protein MTsPCn7_26520 [Altererythrobacter sp. MTPC7]
MRLKRMLAEDSDSLRERSGAKITILEHGGKHPVLINRGQRHSRSFFPSAKVNTVQFVEGLAEERVAKYYEIHGPSIDYQCHQLMIQFMLNRRLRKYISDLSRAFVDAKGVVVPELIEVKRFPGDLRDDDYKEKLAAVRELLRSIGWRFTIINDREMFSPPELLPNVERIFVRRYAGLDEKECSAAEEIIKAGAPVTWGEFRRAVAPTDPLQGDAVIETLIARGKLLTDLEQYLCNSTFLQPSIRRSAASPIRI